MDTGITAVVISQGGRRGKENSWFLALCTENGTTQARAHPEGPGLLGVQQEEKWPHCNPTHRPQAAAHGPCIGAWLLRTASSAPVCVCEAGVKISVGITTGGPREP